MTSRIINLFMRSSGLALKLVLMLYIGKYLSISDIGTYGLVSAVVAIGIPLFGFRIDYIALRELVDLDVVQIVIKIRDQLVIYGITYFIFSLISFLLCLQKYWFNDVKIMMVMVTLTVLESFATITSGNLVPLKRPILANALFFVRSASWIPPLVLIGIVQIPSRNVETVFLFWLLGIIGSISINGWKWRYLPWEKTLEIPINWKLLYSNIKLCLPIWIGSISLVAAAFIDRFIIEIILGREVVGVISFYGSFVVALSGLLSSGIFSFVYPKMISAKLKSDNPLFRKLTKKMAYQALIGSTITCVILGIIVPQLSFFMQKSELYEFRFIFWAMLGGAWIRFSTEYIYYILYAENRDTEIWIGNFIYLLSATAGNILFVNLFGVKGLYFSPIVSTLPLCLWRLRCIYLTVCEEKPNN
jgi:O-antigen/teichoic acid export membrane protein